MTESAPRACRLIVNADDFGIHPAVNEAIFRCAKEGILTSTSVLASAPRASEVRRLQEEFPFLSIGIHLALVEVEPILPPEQIPTLAPDGRFYGSFARFALQATVGGIRPDEIRAELDAQCSRLADLGVRIDHADSHQHLHVLPAVLPIAMDVLLRHGIRKVRHPLDAGPREALRLGLARTLGMEGLRLCALRAAGPLRDAGLQTPDGCIGIRRSGHINPDWLEKTVRTLSPGTWELVAHPASSNRDMAAHFSWGFDSEGELATLTAPRVKDLLTTCGIQRVGYRAM